jgi:outer membrane protein OmpA-like peptidoglycan-associated protein
MPIHRFRSIVHCIALTLVVLTPSGACLAQEPLFGMPGGPSLWFGVYGGANVNLFEGVLRTPSSTISVDDPAGFTKGNGTGLALGGMLEYNSGGLLGGNLMIGYDNRAFDAEQVGGEDLSASPAYISIEPNARINVGGGGLHVTLGPAIAISIASGFEYVPSAATGPRLAEEGDLSDLRGLVIGGQAGVGYDIPLGGYGDPTTMMTPFVQARLGQGLIDPPPGDNDDLGITSIRLGVQLKFGTYYAPPVISDIFPDPVGEFDISLRVPNVITDSRTVRETFPIRNYVFFDAGSTELPERYRRLSSADAATFREEQLVRGEGVPGGTSELEVRSRQQMNAYYNILNVLGDRLRRTATATVRLVGAAGGDAEAGRVMAENVKRYLVDTFAIDARRITTEGQAMPPNRSGSGSSSGEDAKMIAAENYRVSIIGPEEIVRPLNITTVQEEPLDNDVLVTIRASEDIAYWNVEVTDPAGETQRFGPFRNTATARIEAKPLLGAEHDARFIARGTVTMKDGSTVTSGSKEFRLVRTESIVQNTGTRYSILFEFDESKTVQTYEKFLAETVAPSIPTGSTVIIHGHTDVIGTPEYNVALAQRRVDETQRILTRELTRAGKTVTFDTYGFGEDERRAPFDNILPEQRFYNRTVVVEVVPGR